MMERTRANEGILFRARHAGKSTAALATYQRRVQMNQDLHSKFLPCTPRQLSAKEQTRLGLFGMWAAHSKAYQSYAIMKHNSGGATEFVVVEGRFWHKRLGAMVKQFHDSRRSDSGSNSHEP